MRKGLLILLTVLLTVSGAALAQDMPPVYCGDLSEADCAILEQSQAAMRELTAASTAFTIDLLVEAEGETMPFNITGSATYSGFDTMDHALDMSNMTEMPDMQPMFDALRQFNSELILTFNLPEELADDMFAPSSLTLELRLVDGVGYINFDGLQDIVRDMDLSGWGGLDIVSMVEGLIAQMPPEMFDEMFSQLDDMAAMSGVDMDAMSQFSDPEFANQYASIARTDDGSGATATFVTTLDFAAMMADPAMQDLIREQVEAQMDMQGADMGDVDMDMMMEMMDGMFQEMSFLVTEEIDTETFLIASASVAMNMDLSAALTPMGAGSDAQTGMISVNAAVTYEYEDVPVITVPDDAQILPYEMLLGMLMGEGMPQT